MKILVDTVMFQLRAAETSDVRVCTRVLTGMASVAATRDIDLTFLDRGGMPDLGRIETIRFPSYKAADSVADGEMLDRMGRWLGADAFVSTALTMLPSLPNVQLLFGDTEEALLPGREGPVAFAECEIALALSWAVVFASPTSDDAFRSRFPRRRLRNRWTADASGGYLSQPCTMAEAVVDFAAQAAVAIDGADRDSRYFALRRMQAGFELSDSPSLGTFVQRPDR